MSHVSDSEEDIPPLYEHLQVFVIDKSKLTAELLLNKRSANSTFEYEAFRSKLLTTVNAKITDPRIKVMEEAYPYYPLQLHSHCAWQSFETAIYASLVYARIAKTYDRARPATPTALATALQGIDHDFQLWLQFTQVNALEKYMTLHTDKAHKQETPFNHDLVRMVFRVAKLQTDWKSKAVFERLQKLEMDYLNSLSSSDATAWIADQAAFVRFKLEKSPRVKKFI